MNMDNSRKIAFRAWDDRAKKMLIGQSMMNKTLAQLDTWSDRVMQFTGLTDKNGKEIYEGDVVKCFADSEIIARVVDESRLGRGVRDATNTWQGRLENKNDIEIIGNVFENPELIK